MANQERSTKPITKADLRRLGNIALTDLDSLFRRHPETGRLYRHRLFAIALCQGAALHFWDRENGVKDFDIWSFFKAHPKRPFPYRRNGTADFGHSKFGTSRNWEHFVGRRVDLLGRSLKVFAHESPPDALYRYLSSSKTASARALAKKAMILIYPWHMLGTVVWSPEHMKRPFLTPWK